MKLDGRDYPDALAELVERRDAVEIVAHAIRHACGAFGKPNTSRETPPAHAFLANAVESYVSSMGDEDLARVVRDVAKSWQEPEVCPECRRG